MSAFLDTETGQGVDEIIVACLITMLDKTSAAAQAFQRARYWCHLHESINFELRLLSNRTSARQYNVLTVSEVTALITNDFGDGLPSKDIIVDSKDGGPKRILELHPLYMALQYSLLFLYGEDGFHEKIPYHRGHLYQQYFIDAYTAVEEQILQWNRNNQDTLRVDLYHNLNDALTRGDRNAEGLGKRIVLPRSFMGVVYVIEFQKRGLPHAHILLWLEEEWKCKTPSQVADIISAEIPSPTTDPEGYKVVTEFMLHGPYGKGVACTVEEKCSKKIQNLFIQKPCWTKMGTSLSTKGFKGSVSKRSKAIKYLFKYLNKGPDRTTFVIQENVQKTTHREPKKVDADDEIKNYLNCRYLAPYEANLLVLLNREDIKITMFTEWFELNKHDTTARELTYDEIPKGPRGFKELMTVNKKFYPTFKSACFAYGLLNDDNEWAYAISEAQVQLIIWDEASMTQKYAFEVLDKALYDIPRYKNAEKRNTIYGGVTFLLRAESPIEQIMKETFPDFTSRKSDGAYLKERTILTPRNDDADAINAYMFGKLPCLTMTYNSADEVCKASTDVLDQQHLYLAEFLNTLNFSGMPPHALNLKK
ncbi:DNA helicase PIF1, ATP-dependent [Tanacetum coccineum]|uniref:ATP-dependent DNA helicase n=1 Tax=Tanacetum coccineum TaxID=301880 RepID=A0ABQ4YLH9_9ASTR